MSVSFAGRSLLRRGFFPVCLSLSGRGQLRNLLPKSSGVVQEQTSVPLLTVGTVGFSGRHHPTLHFIADMNVCGMAGSGGLRVTVRTLRTSRSETDSALRGSLRDKCDSHCIRSGLVRARHHCTDCKSRTRRSRAKSALFE